MLCLSSYQRFFTHSLHDVLARTRDSSKTPRPCSLCPKVSNTNGKLLSPNHLRSLPTPPHSDLSARQYKGVIPGYDVRTSAWQHVFRGCFRSYSATSSLRHWEGKLCGSCGRKTHPRLCRRCASNTKLTQEAQALGYLVVSLTFFWQRRS